MVCFLCFRGNSYSSADLPVQDALWNSFSILLGYLLQGGVGHIVNFVTQQNLLVFASPHQRAVCSHNYLQLLAES